MRIVVTGASGFIGWHLVDAMARRGDTVQAWTHRRTDDHWQGGTEAIAVDITDRVAVSKQLAAFVPELIIHLAAQSLPGRSWKEPALTYQVNVIGLIHLLESIRRLAHPARLLVAGSSAEYAEPVDARAISEDDPTDPNSPYASSKLAADQLVRLYRHRYDLDVVRFRPFFLAGPRKQGDVCSDFARRIVALERGEERILRVGSLDVMRDIIDIRDGVSGILRIAEVGKSGEVYNVCGGQSVSIGDILDTYRRLAAVPVQVRQDPALLRPLEQKSKVGDPSKLRALGWKPEKELDETLKSILEYWRAASKET
jgi:GDP-4-dehydro-6-deoxy-D-mannose reductase